MKLIKQLLENEGREDQGYVYVMKVEFVGKTGATKTLYSVGGCVDDPVDKLQEILLSFYRARGYFPRATMSRIRKSVDYEQITQLLKYELLGNEFSFGGLQFTGCTKFIDMEQDALFAMYDDMLPSVEGMELVSKLPESFYSEAEKLEITELCIGEDEDYYVVSRCLMNISLGPV